MASHSHSVPTARIAPAGGRSSLTSAHWTAVALATVTGVIHLYLYLTDDWLPFLLAGVGFLAAIGLFLVVRRHRRPIYVAGILFTAAQIAGYLLFPMGPVWLGVLDKAVQVTLIGALAYLLVTSDGRAGADAPEA